MESTLLLPLMTAPVARPFSCIFTTGAALSTQLQIQGSEALSLAFEFEIVFAADQAFFRVYFPSGVVQE